MRKKRASNYKSFRESLIFNLKDNPPLTQKELSEQMRFLGFHITGAGDNKQKKYPTDAQLEVAWNWIKDEFFGEKQTRIEYFYHTEKYEGREINRASKDVTIDGKKYRKGQFTPKKWKDIFGTK